MPVTAKLSRRFYEKLGDDLATELVEWFNSVDATYRADLRELNELNFARFDAKLEQRFAESDGRWERRLAQMDGKWEQRLAQSDARWAHFEAQWDLRDARLDARFTDLESRLDVRIARARADLIKWAFVFTVTAALAVIGLR